MQEVRDSRSICRWREVEHTDWMATQKSKPRPNKRYKKRKV